MLLLLALACKPSEDTSVDPDETGETDVVDTDEVDRRWTFLVFMNGDNDLESYVSHDLNELEQVGSVPGVDVIVQADRSPDYVTDDGDWTGTRRYHIEPDGDLTTIHSPIVEDLGEVDMGDPAVLSDFLVWADETYPADHVAVILWDHGDGWTLAGAAQNAVSWDEGTGNDIAIAGNELVPALKVLTDRRGEKIDLLSFDACNMAFFEVAYALSPVADYLVASQAWVGDEGVLYGTVLGQLRDEPTATTLDIALTMSSTQVTEGGERTSSVTDLSQMPALARAVDAFALAALADDASTQRVADARAVAGSADRVFHDAYLDLADLGSVLASDPDLAVEASALVDATHAAVPGAWGDTRHAFVSGLSINTDTGRWMRREGFEIYHGGPGATWSQDTHWDELLGAILKAEH